MAEVCDANFQPSVRLCVLLVSVVALATQTHYQDAKSWTFNVPGVSFLSFSPQYSNTQNQRISLNFKTRNPAGLLFCHYLKDLDSVELQRINYHLCGELQYGVFVLTYKLMKYSDGISLGQALHNDQWHSLDIFLDVRTGELNVTLDSESRVTSLKAYTRQNFTSQLDWTKQGSVLYFGGTDPDTLFSDVFPNLIGCMSNIQYQSADSKMIAIPVVMRRGVVEGCVNMCTNNPCHHGGACINGYSSAICDCFGSDYQGEFCSELGPATVTLRGYDWLTYTLHPYAKNVLTEATRLSLEFKTSRGSGVLFYAVGGSPYHSHVTASVHAGTVKVSLAFGDEDIEVQAGINVDNYRWHNLTIVHSLKKVHVYLDGTEHIRNILNDKHHLALDPKIFIGGGNNFIVTRGLQVTQNFVGCLKNIYINDVSVLYEMSIKSNKVAYYGGGMMQPEYGCTEVVNIPISFPTAASMLTLDTTKVMANDFGIEFDFKTVRTEAIMLYLSLQDMDRTIEYNFGYIEVWLKAGQPQLKFVPSMLHMDRSQNYTIPHPVNTNVWVSMALTFKNGIATLKVNGSVVSTTATRGQVEIFNRIVLGYGFNQYKASEGYVGCVRNLKVQGQTLDALDLVQSSAASGLIIDGCNITDYCRSSQMCEHGGVCLSEWTDVACDCAETHYTGKACHFSKYKKTCDEYFQAGVNQSGVMLIDLDGPGDLDPVHVLCEMGYEEKYEYFGRTTVDHNLEANTPVRGPMKRNMKKYLTYRGMDLGGLLRLTTESAWCKQWIQYDCIHAPISLGTKTWFRSASGDMIEYLGTNDSQPGLCTCALTDSCAGERCNCDNKTMTLTSDEGYNSVAMQLPITEVNIEQDSNPLDPGTANLTLGPLICWGNSRQRPVTAVTFNTDEGFLVSHSWRSGDLRVSFRTHHSSAIILYQTGTPDNINYFIVAVSSEDTVKFYFRWGLKQLEVVIVSPSVVSDGRWHEVSIETDRHNVRCMLDLTEQILTIPEGVPTVAMFSGILYIGGVPSSVKKDPVVDSIRGMVGCMRGLAYNGRAYPLNSLIDSSSQNTVFEECMASCWPNPCLNGGRCVEEWGAHQCVCANPWAHSGHNCGFDLNTDSVTFIGTRSSYLHYDAPVDSGFLDNTIIFSFRTFLRNTLLLYIHDHLNNFIQVHLQDSNKIIARFNRFNVILQQTKEIKGVLDDGSWNQVVIDNADGYIKVIVNVDDELTRNSYKKLPLESYTQKPFTDEERVSPVRGPIAGPAGIHVYVGGVPFNMSSYQTLYGCIRGLKIGDTVFHLQEEAQKTNGAVTAMCKDGCESSPCKNAGVCDEQWQDSRYVCDCAFSEFAGPTCETEASGYFTGESILHYNYKPPKEAEETRTERLELVFRVNQEITQNMILVFIYSERYWTHDFIIVYLDPNHGIYLNTNQGYAIHGVGKAGRFADGKPHQLLYRRHQGEMILTVRSASHPLFRNKSLSIDEEGIGRVTVSDNTLDELDTIMIGGILNSQFDKIPDTADYRQYLNFTGCMSEVTFYPTGDLPYSLRPLKDIRDEMNSTGVARMFGPDVEGCSTRDGRIVMTTTTPPPPKPSTVSPQHTFPPWNPGPVRTELIGPAPTLPPNKTNPMVTKETTPSTSVAIDTEYIQGSHDKGRHDNKVIAIALCTVGFLVVVAIMVACVLVKLRKREAIRQEAKKKMKEADIELKVPLDDVDAAISENQKNQNYLARLDEFSMVTVTLGARPQKHKEMSTFKPPPSESSFTYSSVPQSEDDGPPMAEARFYNRKKNRPASSISEVLEEMERQRNAPDADPEDIETLHNGPLCTVAMETMPLTCADVLLSPIPERHDDDDNDADNESESPTPPPLPAHVMNEYNGDSGYEAESKPDEEETLMIDSYLGNDSYAEEVTPTPHSYFPSSPGSKNSNYTSDNNASPMSRSDNESIEKHSDSFKSSSSRVTAPEDSKVIHYGFPNSPVIDINNGSHLLRKQSSVVTQDGQET